jgi:hypothetical protein
VNSNLALGLLVKQVPDTNRQFKEGIRMFRNRSKTVATKRPKTRSRSRKQSMDWVTALFLQVVAIVAFVGLLSTLQETRHPSQLQPPQIETEYHPAIVQSEYAIDPRYANIEYGQQQSQNTIHNDVEIDPTRFDNYGAWR